MGSVDIDVPVALAKVVDKLIDINEGQQPILGYSGSKASTRELKKRFTAQELSKKMVDMLGTTLNNLRSVYVTENVVSKQEVKKDEEIAKRMLHSTKSQRGFYAKNE